MLFNCGVGRARVDVGVVREWCWACELAGMGLGLVSIVLTGMGLCWFIRVWCWVCEGW